MQSEKAKEEQRRFNLLKAELQRAFAAPEESYQPLRAVDIIVRNCS